MVDPAEKKEKKKKKLFSLPCTNNIIISKKVSCLNLNFVGGLHQLSHDFA